MPQVTVVDSSPPAPGWAPVVEANVDRVGVDPRVTWEAALTDLGIEPGKPDKGSQRTCRCPVPTHNGDGDSKASMRWTQAPDGRILMQCQAGCEFEDILTATSMDKSQLQWSQTDYYYRGVDRGLRAVHVRLEKTSGKSFIWQWENAAGERVNGRDAKLWDGPTLWLLPDLIEQAAHAHEHNRDLVVWIPEGEKDVVSLADWLDIGVVPEHLKTAVHVATTSPDGAGAAWDSDLTEQLRGLAPSKIIVLCDNDDAGRRRGSALLDALSQICSVEAWVWADVVSGHRVKDVSDVLYHAKSRWWKVKEALGEADAYSWASYQTGWLHEADAYDTEGHSTGERTLCRIARAGTKQARSEPVGTGPLRVLHELVDDEDATTGWEVSVAGKPVALTIADLNGSRLAEWNATHGMFITSARALAEPVRAYLQYHGARSPKIRSYAVEGWNGRDIFATKDGILWSELPGVGGRVPAGSADLWHYGTYGDGGEAAAAALVADILSFRDADESGPALGWLASVACGPMATEAVGLGRTPLLQAIGSSGKGKTRWLELATRIFGYKAFGIGSATRAGLIRMLASGTGVVWIDDAALEDDTADLIRSSITGGGRVRGNIDGERGTTKDEAVASMLYSAEAGFRLNERAMSQRSAVVHFNKSVQTRKSFKTVGRDGKPVPQYEDMVALGSGTDSHQLLTAYAGIVIQGLIRVSRGEAREVAIKADSGIREAGAYRFVQYGARILAVWLDSHGQHAAALELSSSVERWVLSQVDWAKVKESSGLDQYAFTELIPRYLTWARRTGRSVDVPLQTPLPSLGPDDVREGAKRAFVGGVWGNATNAVHNAPAVVVLNCGGSPQGDDSLPAVLIASDLLYHWATSKDGLDSGVSKDIRHVGIDSIRAQVAVADCGIGPQRVILRKPDLRPSYRLVTNQTTADQILGALGEG